PLATMTMQTTTNTTFTVRKMTGRRISKLSTILLFCAALLLTNSCGIVALSGDGESASSGQGLAQAEPWSDTTTITTLQPGEEGSGDWDTTTLTNEETTEASANEETPITTLSPEETTQPEEDTTKADIDDETSTAAAGGSGNGETTTPAEQESSSSGSGDGETTTDAPENSSSTSAPEQSSSSVAPEDTTTVEPETTSSTAAPDTTIAPTPPTFNCQTAGLFPDINGNCQRYHNCLLNPVLHQLQDVEVTCPDLTVFSASLKRCVRDVAECPDDTFQCPGVGRFAGHDDTYYYSCVASLQGGFHKFVVRCSSGQRFEATIGGCWRYDWTQIVPGQEASEVSDLAAIKRELKQYKAEEKLRLKAQKQQEKLARKQQKLEEKAAKKAAKEQAKQQAKADKDKAKGESIESAESAE
ncbi:hypothetical protein KR059_000521, partial [Drosophila kikkawai]